MRWFFDPLVSAGLPMPKIGLPADLHAVVRRLRCSKIMMIAFSAVFPVIVEAWAGTQNIDKYMSWSAMSLGTGRKQFLWEIALPAAMPQVFTGLQVALPIALIVAIVCEMQMGGEGWAARYDRHALRDSPGVFSGIIAIALVGVGWSRRWSAAPPAIGLAQETQTS